MKFNIFSVGLKSAVVNGTVDDIVRKYTLEMEQHYWTKWVTHNLIRSDYRHKSEIVMLCFVCIQY